MTEKKQLFSVQSPSFGLICNSVAIVTCKRSSGLSLNIRYSFKFGLELEDIYLSSYVSAVLKCLLDFMKVFFKDFFFIFQM